MATSVLSARSAAVTMSSESASSCSVIGCGSTSSDAEILVGPRSVTDRQLLVPSPMWQLFRTLDLAMPATDRLPGTLGPYRLQDRLGEGGMGVVHLPRDPQGGLVAVKVLHPGTTESPNLPLRLPPDAPTIPPAP